MVKGAGVKVGGNVGVSGAGLNDVFTVQDSGKSVETRRKLTNEGTPIVRKAPRNDTGASVGPVRR